MSLERGELPEDGLPRIVLLQARNKEGAKHITGKINSMPLNVELISMLNDVFKTQTPAYLWRGYTVVPALDKNIANIQEFNSTKRPVWYIFSGMGSQWPGMGTEFLKIPVFASAVQKCDKVLRPKGLDIKRIITTKDPTIFENILNCFVGIATIQVGLVDILNALGVIPDGMIGHSVGELGCGYADGCFTAEEMVLAAYARGKASLESVNFAGMMAAVGLGYNEIKDQLPSTIDVACHNSVDSCTISGPSDDVLKYVEQLKSNGVFAKAVSAGGIAYHSRYIRSIAPRLLKYLKAVIPNPKPRSSRWISSSVPRSQWHCSDAKGCSAEYHTNNLLNPVLFEEAIEHISNNALIIEIAPRGLLQAILRRAISPECTTMSLTSSNAHSNFNHLLTSIGNLFLNNVDLDVNALFPPIEYPVTRGTPSLTDFVTWDHTAAHYHGLSSNVEQLLTKGFLENLVKITPESEDYRLFKEYRVDGKAVVPISKLLLYPWKMIYGYKRLKYEECTIISKDVTIAEDHIACLKGNELVTTFVPVSLNFEVTCESEETTGIIFSGKIEESQNLTFKEITPDVSDMQKVQGDEIYFLLKRLGCSLGPQFQTIICLYIGSQDCMAVLKWTGNYVVFMENLFKIVTFIRVGETDRPLLMSSFKKLTINFGYLSNLDIGTEVTVHYDHRCNRLVCEAVELLGLTFTQPRLAEAPSLRWAEVKLLPYYESIPSIEEFISRSIWIVVEEEFASWRQDTTEIIVMLVKSEDSKLSTISNLLEQPIKHQPNIKFKIMELDINEMKGCLISLVDKCILVVGEYTALNDVVDLNPVHDKVYFLAYLKEKQALKHQSPMKPILLHQSNVITIALFKCVGERTTTQLFEILCPDWLIGLRKLMKEDISSPVVVFSHTLKPIQCLPIIAREPFYRRVRIFFILDTNAPRFSLNSSLYSTQVSLGLPVNILFCGGWSTVRNLAVDITEGDGNGDFSFVGSIDADVNICCLGLNSTIFFLHTDSDIDPEVKYVDYSGIAAGQRIMGMAELDPLTNVVAADPILRMTVPPDWSMEDAATVPVIYFVAYYCMHLKAKVQPGENVLVQGGMSLIGQAVIKIGLQSGANIFTSVFTDDEAIAVSKHFPSLKPKHVLVMERGDVAVNVKMMTAGKGVEVIVNCLRGRHLQSCIKLMGFDCRFLHLGEITMEDRESIGMCVFLKRTSFHGITLRSVVNCIDEWKVKLIELMQHGIEHGTIKPFSMNLFSVKQQKAAQRHLKEIFDEKKTVIVIKSPDQLRENGVKSWHDPEHFVLLAGMKNKLWLEVVDWLISSGTRKVIVLAEDDTENTNYLNRVNDIIHLHEGELLFTPLSRADLFEDAVNMLKELSSLGSISTILCLGMDQSNASVINLDMASRQVLPHLQQFLCLLGEGTAVYESRSSAGLPVCSVKCDSPLNNLVDILPHLSSLLSDNNSHPRFFTVSNDTNTKLADKIETLDHEIFPLLSLEGLYEIGSKVEEKGIFTEKKTLSPGYQHMRYTLLPVFLIPGLCFNILDALVRHLMYPAFTCSLPADLKSVDKLACHLLQDVLAIQRKGCYNLVGDCWSGAVTLELGCLLEARGHKVALFLLEGTPSMAQERLNTLRKRYSADLATTLLANLLNLSDQLVNSVRQQSNWGQKLATALEQVPQDKRYSVGKALTSIYSQMVAVQEFKGPSQMFKGKLTLISHSEIQPSHLDNLTKFCEHAPVVIVTKSNDMIQMISSLSTASIINENTLFDWNL